MLSTSFTAALVSVLASLVVAISAQPCPSGSQQVSCYMDPCQFATCPTLRSAVCRPSLCDNCRAEWTMNGVDVTPSCAKMSTVLAALSQKTETLASGPQTFQTRPSTGVLASARPAPFFGSRTVPVPVFNTGNSRRGGASVSMGQRRGNLRRRLQQRRGNGGGRNEGGRNFRALRRRGGNSRRQPFFGRN